MNYLYDFNLNLATAYAMSNMLGCHTGAGTGGHILQTQLTIILQFVFPFYLAQSVFRWINYYQ